MSDLPIEAPQSAGQTPHLSEAALDSYREAVNGFDKALADPGTSPALREFYEKQKASIEAACKITGQTLTQQDPRTIAQQAHDTRHGMQDRRPADYALALANSTPVGFVQEEGKTTVGDLSHLAAAMSLPVDLAKGLTSDLLSSKETPDAEKMAEQLQRLGKDYREEIKAAEEALSYAALKMGKPPTVKAQDLPLFSLVQLAIWGRHLKAWQGGRPA